MNRSDDLFSGGPTGTPNGYWKRAFEEAAETPPPRVWDAVERQLDLDDEDGIIPLWQHRDGQRSMLFGRWVAGIAASLLLTLFGWWAWHRDSALPATSATLATTQTGPATQASQPAGTPTVTTQRGAATLADQSEGVAAPLVAAVSGPQRTQVDKFAHRRLLVAKSGLVGTWSSDASTVALASTRAARLNVGNVPKLLNPSGGESVALTQGEVIVSYGQVTMSIIASPSALSTGDNPVETTLVGATLKPTLSTPSQVTLTEQESPARLAQSLMARSAVAQPAKGKQESVKEIDPSANESASLAEVVQAKQQSIRRKPWVSVSAGTSAFNSEMALRASSVTMMASNAGFNNAIVSQTRQAALINATVGRAVAIQAGFGLPLGEHWAIETGVGYLNSQGTVSSPARAASIGTAQSATDNRTFYSELIANRVAAAQGAPTVNPAQDFAGLPNRYLDNGVVNYSLTEQRSVSNNYQFVQVPAQVSYEFRPRRKFGLALLTGFVSNWFVRNTVAETVTVKAGDGIYRPVTVAGTAGMRFRFRPDRHWSASLAGTFQQNLQSLTLNDVSLQALPQQVGVSFSVDRHF